MYPEDPTTSPGYVNGHRLIPLCETCSYYGSAEYLVEKMGEEQRESKTICAVDGCPIWKTVAKLVNDIQALQSELAHVHAHTAKKKTETKEGYW